MKGGYTFGKVIRCSKAAISITLYFNPGLNGCILSGIKHTFNSSLGQWGKSF